MVSASLIARPWHSGLTIASARPTSAHGQRTPVLARGRARRARGRGEDAAQFLQGLVTNDVTGALPVYAALLTAQGKMLFDFIVWPGGDGALLLDCEAGAGRGSGQAAVAVSLAAQAHDRGRPGARDLLAAELGDGGAPDPRLADLGQRWVATLRTTTGRSTRIPCAIGSRSAFPKAAPSSGDLLWLGGQSPPN
jgi:hypothetical protein